MSAGRLSLPLLLLASCTDLSVHRAPVVYGDSDDRREVFEHPSATHRAIARSAIAMQIGFDSLDVSDPDDVRITYDQTLGEAHELCEGVRYADQLEPGTCSGTLIDDRHILTAGHCVPAAEDCDGESWPWIFGWHYESAGTLRTLTRDDVYFCVGTPVFVNDDVLDYAVIELDRPVVSHEPAVVARERAPLGTPVTLIGHPNGIPMKIAGGATIRGEDGPEIYADVDAFYGNSGSGVFDDAGEVIGILVAGAPDDYVDVGPCFEIETIDPVPEGDGEILIAAEIAIDAFCETGVRSPACGSPGADAGTALDAGPEIDAGSEDDGGSSDRDGGSRLDAGTGEPGGGCGCRATAPSAGAIWPFALAFAALARRRRR